MTSTRTHVPVSGPVGLGATPARPDAHRQRRSAAWPAAMRNAPEPPRARRTPASCFRFRVRVCSSARAAPGGHPVGGCDAGTGQTLSFSSVLADAPSGSSPISPEARSNGTVQEGHSKGTLARRGRTLPTVAPSALGRVTARPGPFHGDLSALTCTGKAGLHAPRPSAPASPTQPAWPAPAPPWPAEHVNRPVASMAARPVWQRAARPSEQ